MITNGEVTERFRHRLRALRDHRGVSQRELAQRLGSSHNVTISKIETGKRAIKLDEAWALAEALGADPLEMLSPEPFQVSITLG